MDDESKVFVRQLIELHGATLKILTEVRDAIEKRWIEEDHIKQYKDRTGEREEPSSERCNCPQCCEKRKSEEEKEKEVMYTWVVKPRHGGLLAIKARSLNELMFKMGVKGYGPDDFKVKEKTVIE